MSQWHKLPTEVLQIMFEHLQRDFVKTAPSKDLTYKTIRECLRVCRGWREPAHQFLYSRQPLVFDLVSKFDDFLQVVNNGKAIFNFGRYVLKLEFPHDSIFFNPIFKRLMKLIPVVFPNLQTIIPGHPAMGERKPYYLALLSFKQREPNVWPNFNMIAEPTANEDIEFYNACNIEFLKSIQHLTMVDRIYYNAYKNRIEQPQSQVLYETEFNHLVDHLQDFKKLRTLTIHKTTHKSIQQFDNVIEKTSKSLSTLTINLYSPTKKKEEKEDHDVDLTTVTARPRINHLSGSFILYNDNTLEYIMKKFSHIKKFKMDNTLQNQELMDKASNHYTPTILAKFLSYVYRLLAGYKMTGLYIKDIANVLSIMEPSFYQEMMARNLNIRYKRPSEIIPTKSTMEATELISMEGFLETIVTFIEGETWKSRMEHMDLIEKCGRAVNSLKISSNRNSNDILNEFTQHMSVKLAQGYFLDHIFQHCTKLRELKVYNSVIKQLNPTMQKNTSVRQLHLTGCQLYKDALSEMSARLPFVKWLYLENIQFLAFKGVIIDSNHITLDLPYSNLDMLSVTYGLGTTAAKETRIYTSISLKFSTLTGERFFIVKVDDQEDSMRSISSSFYGRPYPTVTMDQYHANLNKKFNLSFHIRCQSIKSFHLMYSNPFCLFRNIAISNCQQGKEGGNAGTGANAAGGSQKQQQQDNSSNSNDSSSNAEN